MGAAKPGPYIVTKIQNLQLAAPPGEMTPAQTTQYTIYLIESIRKFSFRQGHILLAHFLEIAAAEACSQATLQAQDTRLPE